MKNIVFYITHKTLGIEHAELTFKSFSNQDCNNQFDCMYIYNSHEDELSNEVLINLVKKYDLNKFFKQIHVFNYDISTPKALGADIDTIKNFCKKNYLPDDRVLLIKSDTVVSVNFFDDILNKLPKEGLVYFVAPWICAKKRVSDSQIIEYCNRKSYVRSDDITFFVEDQYQSIDNDFFNRKGVDVTDENILFTSCYVIRDFSCHFLSVALFDLIRIEYKSWAGVWFSALERYFIPTNRSFVVHKYHSIISENRETDREGPVKDWLHS